MKKRLLSLIAFALLYSTLSWGVDPQILTFEFSALAGNEATASSSSNDANLNASSIARGSGLTASLNGGRFNATNWALTSIDNAVLGDKYMEFTITPKAGYQFSISAIVIQMQRSGTGPRAIALRSSIDNYTANLDQVYDITDNTNTQGFTFTFAQANSSTAVTYRVYMWAEATGGSGGIGDASGDDLVIYGTTSALAGSPVITVSETSLSGFSYVLGNGPSAAQTFTVSGSNLTNHITITPPAQYEISLDGVDYFLTYGFLTLVQTGGSVSATTIYTRLKSGLPIGAYNGQNISIASIGASSKTLTCNGYVEGKQTSTLPYTNDFTSGFGKINSYDAGGDDFWALTSGAAMINGYPNTDAVDVDWMFLPSVDFSAYSQVELYFDAWWRYGNQDANNFLKVLYSTNYAGFGNPSGATWTEIPFTAPATEQTWTTIGPLDLSAITATDVHIAFKYQSDDAARQWYIDNINLQIYTPPPTVLANAWINEIHYDNSGVDVDESIEVAVDRADTLTLSDITVTLYNGGDGAPYNTKTLDQFTQGATVGDYTFFYYNYTANAQSIQNGPDGIALDWKGNLIQFISYGGSFNGVGGPANAVASTNINVIETGTTAVGYSLQLVGTGLNYNHFMWIDPPANFGNLNNNQLLAPPPPPVPVDWRYILMAFVLIAGITVYRKLR